MKKRTKSKNRLAGSESCDVILTPNGERLHRGLGATRPCFCQVGANFRKIGSTENFGVEYSKGVSKVLGLVASIHIGKAYGQRDKKYQKRMVDEWSAQLLCYIVILC